MNVLEVRSVSKTYGSGEAAVHALKKASFCVPKGEFVAIVGESGSGKSTLLNLIGALDTPTSGRVIIDGRDIFAMKEASLTVFRRRNIGFIFQSFHLIPELTAEQNIMFPALLDYQKPDIKYLEELLEGLHLKKRRSHLPSQLSGGQQQRVSIARTLVQQADIILADEPVASLDPVTTRKILEDLRQINRNMEKTVIINIHSVELAKEFAGRILGFQGGRVIFDGTPEELTPEELKRIYGKDIGKEKEGAGDEA